MPTFTSIPYEDSLKKIQKALPKQDFTQLKLLFDAAIRVNKLSYKKPDFLQGLYSYADPLLNEGRLNIDRSFDHEFYRYSPIPLGIVISKAVEIASEHTCESPSSSGGKKKVKTATLTSTIIGEGELFGLFELMDTYFGFGSSLTSTSWIISAGARGIRINLPYGTYEDVQPWEYLRDRDADTPWEAEVLYVPRTLLFASNRNNTHSIGDMTFLFKYAWKQNKVALQFNNIIDNKVEDIYDAAAVSPSMPDNVFWFWIKVMLLAQGSRPGYSLVDLSGKDVDLLAPFSRLSNLSTKYDSICMEPTFSLSSNSPIYLSLYDPTPINYYGYKLRDNDKCSSIIESSLAKLKKKLPAWLASLDMLPYNFPSNKEYKSGTTKLSLPSFSGIFSSNSTLEQSSILNFQKIYNQHSFFKGLVGLATSSRQ